MLDLERLEVYVERCKMRTLEWETERGHYALGNSIIHPAYWEVSFTSKGMPLQPGRERRGLKSIIDLIETNYPEFYAHLLETFPKSSEAKPLDVRDIRGYAHVKRCLEIAASGGHNTLLVGYPGKDLLQLAEAFKIIIWRSFHSPLVSNDGEGAREVLFLDLNPFDQESLTDLAKTIEAHAQFIFIATVKPCPCGYYDDPTHPCCCDPLARAQYQQALCEIVRTCFAMQVWVPSTSPDTSIAPDVAKMFPTDSSEIIHHRIELVRNMQEERYKEVASLLVNGDLRSQDEIKRYCESQTDSIGQGLIRMAVRILQLSPVEVQHVWVIARTIADMDNRSLWIKSEHIAQAIMYRSRFARDT